MNALVVSAATVALARSPGTVAFSLSPAAQVAATMQAEAAAWNARHLKALWNLHTPRFRSTCGRYAKYVAAEKRLRDRFGTERLTRVRITVVSPSRAVANYVIVTQLGDKIVNTDDVYSKVGSSWLDDLNGPGKASCGY